MSNENAPSESTSGEDGITAAVAQVGETTYTTLDAAFAALDSTNRTLTLLNESAWDAATPVYYKAGETSGYAAKLTDALTAAYKANISDITIVCRPGSDLGAMTHGHVADNITIYGNGAYVSGGECDLEVDTYQFDRSTGKQTNDAVTELAGKTIAINAYDVDNLGVWGQRSTDATVNVNLTNCDGKGLGAANAQRVYISGTSGENNITLTDCKFITANTAVYSNADGTVTVNSCSFTGSIVPVNFNHKAAGTQTVTVANSTFTNCGTTGDWAAFAAPARFVNSGTGTLSATINACSFTETAGANGDILIGDGRTDQKSNEVTLTVANTKANVQAQKPGYYGTDGQVADASLKGEVATTTEKGLDGASINSIVTPTSAAVAEVNDKSYVSLQEAIDAAQDGETVTLLADATEDVILATGKNITLDLGGNKLTNTNKGKATISVQGGTVTVKNGNVAGGTSYYNIEVTKGSNANLTLTDVTATAGNNGSSMIDNWGTMTIASGTYTGGLNVVKSEEGSKLIITGGTFTRTTAPRWGVTGTVLVYGTTTITGGTFNEKSTSANARVVVTGRVDGYDSVTYIKGGTFNGNGNNVFHHLSPARADDSFEVSGGTFNKSIPDYYCTDGFIPKSNGDGTYGVKEGKFVAKVGSTGYETFDEAIAAANASTKSKTVSLCENITVDHQLVINNAKGKTITLDLNDFTLTSTYAMNNASSEARYALVNKTTLTVKKGTFAAGEARAIGAYGALTLNGATVTQTLTGGQACVAFCANGKAYTIENSTIDGAYAVCNFANNATINITGSKLIGTGNTLYHNGSNYGLKLTVKDTTITSSGSDGCGVYISGSTSAQSNADNQNGAGGYQKAVFTGCTISGATNGVEVKYTDLTLDSCTASTTAENASYEQDNNGPAGSGFAVVSTDNAMNNATPKPEGTIVIKGTGKYTGPVGLGSLESVKEAYADFADETIKVSGGTFSVAVPDAYCAAGYTPTANADGTYGVRLAEGAYLLQDYRSGNQASWTYPTQKGMAFAGWYKDAEFKTACTASDVEGAAYAKFVKITDLLQFKGGSLRMDVGDPTELTYLRFGYTMAIPEGSTFVENGWYYKKVTEVSPDDVRFVAYNNTLNSDGTITSNLVFNKVETSLYTSIFTEKAFVKYATADGTTVEAVEGTYQSRSVSEVADAIIKHPMANKTEKEYAQKIKSTIQQRV